MTKRGGAKVAVAYLSILDLVQKDLSHHRAWRVVFHRVGLGPTKNTSSTKSQRMAEIYPN
jgi:hypothetical protein